MRWRELRRRLWLPILAFWLASHLGAGLFLLNAGRSIFQASFEQQLVLTARAVSAAAFSAAESATPLENAVLSNAYVILLDARGMMLRQHPASNIRFGASTSWPDVQRALNNSEISLMRDYSPLAGGTLLFCTAPALDTSGQIIGAVTVALPDAERAVNAGKNRLTLTWLGLLAGSLLLGAAMLIFISSWLEKQLDHLLISIQVGTEAGRPVSRALAPLWSAWTAASWQFQQTAADMETEIAQLRSALDNMTDGVMIVDQQGRILLMNPACRRLLEIPESDITGSFAQMVRDYRIVELWQNLFASPEIRREVPAPIEIFRDQSTLLVSGVRIPFAGEERALIMIQDVTQARRIEAMRRDFVNNVSHELRTPLASIKALVETLREGALEDPPAARHFLARIESEVDSLVQMVQELLELARLESGRSVLNRQTVDLAAVIMPAVDRLLPQAKRAGLHVVLDIPSDLPRVYIDPSLFRQVITNLVHNAIKFTPAGGEIRITARAAKEEIIVSVSDTGIGIPKEDLPRIFERFYKADRSRAGGGTGLGLAIAKHVVLSHGGRIWAESQEGRGSTFYFTIPLSGAGAETSPNR